MKILPVTLFFLLGGFSLTFSQTSRPIKSVETQTAIFIGHTETAIRNGRNVYRQSVLITSWAQYEKYFGGPTSGYYLHESVKLFFENGGKRTYVISVGSTLDPVQKTRLTRGLNVSRQVNAQLVLIPDAVALAPTDFYAVQGDMLALCAELGDRFAILNTRLPSTHVQQDIQAFRAGIAGSPQQLSHGAVYYPWLVTNSGATVPPAGAVAGAYVQTDRNRGVWKAPANVSLRGVSALSQQLSSAEREYANVSPADGKSVNTIAQFSGKGILVWGARTLAGNDNEWRYVPVRRLALLLEKSAEKGLEWAVFEPNDANLWTGVEKSVSDFLYGFYRQGAFQGARPEQAYFVKCGLGETMTQQDLANGKLIVELGFAPVRPAEFVVLRLEWKMR